MAESTAVKVGDLAPDFSLSGTGGRKFSLGEQRGKKNVLLAFYPMDWTPG